MKNELSVVYNKGHSFLLGTQPKRCFYFVFQRVREPWKRYNRPRYTQEDAEKMAADVANIPVSETIVFGELWRKRWRGAVIDIEEGILNRWFYGRTVLVGDTAHKVSSAATNKPPSSPSNSSIFTDHPKYGSGRQLGHGIRRRSDQPATPHSRF